MELTRVGPQTAAGAGLPPGLPRKTPGGGGFADALRDATGVQFSRHAEKRMDRRELGLDPAGQERLNSAITSAAQKGARQSVVLIDDLAVVVNIRDRTVVTAMSTEGGRQRVFTNVDSVVIG